jgi:tetratricopeptide (TPR) repeat protein
MRACKAYPHSDIFTAIYSQALVQGTAINAGKEAALRLCIENLSAHRTESIRLYLHVLLGDLQNPAKALAAMPQGFSIASIPESFTDRDSMIINSALLNIIKGDSADAEMEELLRGYSNRITPSARVLGFAANYYYHFGDPRAAAELYSRIPSDEALASQADALWLAGFPGAAGNIWNVLSIGESNYKIRALYNLACTEKNKFNEAAYLYAISSLPRIDTDKSREYGIIRFSRLLDPVRAISLLENEISAEPIAAELFDLELLRRRAEIWEKDRLIAAAWILLNKYPDDERLYQWVNRYFIFQRCYSESAILLQKCNRKGFDFSFDEAFLLLQKGDYEKAGKLFTVLASGEKPMWQAQANLGRILQASHDPGRSIQYFEKAAAQVSNNTDASRIQYRIAQCLKSLGRIADVRRVLEYALDLNPDNLDARLELSRL